MDQLKRQKPYFKNFDSLRFLAAFFVLSGHCFTNSLGYLNLPYPISNFLKIICTGSIWVSFFFVLSGFLVGYISFVEKKHGEFNVRKFLMRRLLRIWPLYFAVVIAGLIVFPLLSDLIFHKHYEYHVLWKYLLFLGNFCMVDIYKFHDFAIAPDFVNKTWSISIEEQFYLLLAILIAVFSLKMTKWILTAAAIIGVCFIGLNTGKPWLNYHSLYYLFDFSIGCLGGYFMLLYPACQSFFKKFKNQIAILLILFGLIFIFTFKESNTAIQKIPYCVFFLLLIGFAGFSEYKSFEKFGGQKNLVYLGKISYGIYLIHPFFQYPFKLLVDQFLQSTGQLNKDLCVWIATSVFTIALASLSFKYFESYFLRMKKKWR